MTKCVAAVPVVSVWTSGPKEAGAAACGDAAIPCLIGLQTAVLSKHGHCPPYLPTSLLTQSQTTHDDLPQIYVSLAERRFRVTLRVEFPLNSFPARHTVTSNAAAHAHQLASAPHSAHRSRRVQVPTKSDVTLKVPFQFDNSRHFSTRLRIS